MSGLDELDWALVCLKSAVTGGLPTGGLNLLVYSPDVAATADLHRRYMLGSAEMLSAANFVALEQALGNRKGKSYAHLVIDCHGEAGQIKLGTIQKDLDQLSLDWQNRGVPLPTVTEAVTFLSCNAASRLDGMARMAALFRAPQAEGWNKFHVTSIIHIALHGGTKETRRAEFLTAAAPYKPYLLPFITDVGTLFDANPSAADVALPCEWYNDDGDPASLQPEITDPQHEKRFIPRGKAVTVTVHNQSEEDGLDLQEQDPAGQPLRHVFVKARAGL